MGQAEGIVETYLKKECEKQNFTCYKFTSPGTTGVPDRIVIGNGQTIFVETKSSTGRLEDKQIEEINRMRQNGAIVYIASSHKKIDTIIQNIISGKHPAETREKLTQIKVKTQKKPNKRIKEMPKLNTTKSAFK